MIRCNACGFVKVDDLFYSSNQSKCKECVKKNVRANRVERIDYYRAYDRARGSRQTIEQIKKYRTQNEVKYLAHNKVNNAVRDGRLIKQPCEACGDKNVHGHHDDYTKPLEVRWLCPAHHHQWHAQNGEAKTA